MKKELIKAQVEWSPRSRNAEADALANGKFEDFDPCLRLEVDSSKLVWELLPQTLKMGAEAKLESKEAAENGTIPNRGIKQRKRKPQERMRFTDPW